MQPEPTNEFTRLEPHELNHVHALVAFLDDAGPVGWEKLRTFEESLPDLHIEQYSFSNLYTFKNNDVELGHLRAFIIYVHFVWDDRRARFMEQGVSQIC